MSDSIKHECGIALIRLRKPFQYYLDKYNSPTYGLGKLYLMMEKQVNRGQDGAGVANIKINVKPGHRYISRYRSVEPQAVADIFSKIDKKFKKAHKLAYSSVGLRLFLKMPVLIDYPGDVPAKLG